MKINTIILKSILAVCLISLLGISNLYGSDTNLQSTDVLPSRLWIDLKSEANTASQMAVAYLPQCTLGVDFGYDAARFSEGNIMSIYSLIDNVPFTIQARPSFSADDIVPIGIQVIAAGMHSISLNHCDGVFSQGQEIYILDTATGSIINLHDRPMVADLDSGTYNTRFVMGYSYNALQTLAVKEVLSTELMVFTANNIIYVHSDMPVQNIIICDISGKLLYNSAAGLNSQNISINGEAWKHQPLVLQIFAGNKRTIKKLIY